MPALAPIMIYSRKDVKGKYYENNVFIVVSYARVSFKVLGEPVDN